MNFVEAAAIWQSVANGGVSKTIAPDDRMYHMGTGSAGSRYFAVGSSGLVCVLKALLSSRLDAVASVLDFACGHGRVARHLRAAFPAAGMTFCDIDRSGVDFCAGEFGGRAVYSSEELAEVDLGGTYDVIWIGSLFTHLPEHRIRSTLAQLTSRLSTDGVLVATFHGVGSLAAYNDKQMIHHRAWTGILAQYEEDGFGYAPYKGQQGWGLSLAKPAWVLRLSEQIDGVRVLDFMERGWANNHDVLVLGKTDRYESIAPGRAAGTPAASWLPQPRMAPGGASLAPVKPGASHGWWRWLHRRAE